MTSSRVGAHPDAARGERRRAPRSPAISALYSATLLVAMPMHSLTLASRTGGSTVASSTTAPIAAGPGFPRAPPSHWTSTVSTSSRSRSRRDEDGAAVVAVEHRGLVGAGRWMRSTSVAGIVSRQPWHVLPISRAAPAPWFARRIRSYGASRSAGIAARGDAARFELLRRARRRSPTPARPARPRAASASAWSSPTRLLDARRPRASSVSWRLHQLELTVVERPAGAGSSCSTSACIACSSRGELIEPEYIVFSTSLMRAVTAELSSSSRLTSRTTSSRRPRASASWGVERGDLGLGAGEHLALGEGRPPVSQTLGGRVVVLHDEKLLERTHRGEPTGRLQASRPRGRCRRRRGGGRASSAAVVTRWADGGGGGNAEERWRREPEERWRLGRRVLDRSCCRRSCPGRSRET